MNAKRKKDQKKNKFVFGALFIFPYLRMAYTSLSAMLVWYNMNVSFVTANFAVGYFFFFNSKNWLANFFCLLQNV